MIEVKEESSLNDKSTNRIEDINNNINFSNETDKLSSQEKEVSHKAVIFDNNQSSHLHFKYTLNHKCPNNHNHSHTHNHTHNHNHNHIHNHTQNHIHNHTHNHTQGYSPSLNNIGNNIVLRKKYVVGPIYGVGLLLFVAVGLVSELSAIIIFLGPFYPKYVYIIYCIIVLLMEIFMFLTFFTEPGIIPKNHPDYQGEIKISEDDEKDITIPRIYTQRKCPTCNIIRPPGASHCNVCNNCVLDFDHHCAFVSNCIGRRNHKYFYYFLLMGHIAAIKGIIINIRVIKYVFITKYDETISFVIKGNKTLLYIMIASIIIAVLFPSSSRSFPSIPINTFIFGGIAFGLYFYLWYKYIPIKEGTPSYFNPFIIITFIIVVMCYVFITGNLCGQTYVITQNITIKQYASINEKVRELYKNHRDLKVNEKYTKRKSIIQSFKNLFGLMFSKIDESLIIPERDL